MKQFFKTMIIAASLALMVPTFPCYAETSVQEIIKKNKESYTAGMQSVYGPGLNQEQLNQVAAAVTEFKNTYVMDTMTDEEKIKAASDYLKNVCSYAEDWSRNGANTAWGALVYHEAQCSGYARAFKALCDSMDIGCYYVHAKEDSWNQEHQWNIVQADGVWYHIDVQANDSSGFDFIYLTTEAPVPYDESAYPEIGNFSMQTKNEEDAAISEEENVQKGLSLTTTPTSHLYEGGAYEVGVYKDFLPGEYVIIPQSDSVNFDISDGDGSERLKYNMIVYLGMEKTFYISDTCSITPIDEMPEIDYRKGAMFKVGYHIPEGTYRLRMNDDSEVGYYEVGYSCFPQARYRVLRNDFFHTKTVLVNVRDGDFLKLGFCQIEGKVD